jgi:hypothetical protein
LNGTWSAFQLVDIRTNKVCAWFSCHSDVDPEVEIDMILRVAGSPYEDDSASSNICPSVAAKGVLVVNRGYWGNDDDRGRDGVPETASDDEGDDVGPESWGEAVGLVDFANAKAQVLDWRSQNRAGRHQSPVGVWMFIPDSEYMFGRFGFDDARTSAKSFIFFTTDTQFVHTAFIGRLRPLRENRQRRGMFSS